MSSSCLSTVLVIDDDQGMRDLLSILLDSAGIECFVAHDASTAVELLKANMDKISACLLDLNLEHAQGEQVYDLLKEISPDLPILPMSGIYSDEIRERFEGREIAGIITKPFRANQLIETVKSCLV